MWNVTLQKSAVQLKQEISFTSADLNVYMCSFHYEWVCFPIRLDDSCLVVSRVIPLSCSGVIAAHLSNGSCISQVESGLPEGGKQACQNENISRRTADNRQEFLPEGRMEKKKKNRDRTTGLFRWHLVKSLISKTRIEWSTVFTLKSVENRLWRKMGWSWSVVADNALKDSRRERERKVPLVPWVGLSTDPSLPEPFGPYLCCPIVQ